MPDPVFQVEDILVQLSDGRVVEAKPVRIVDGTVAQNSVGGYVDVQPVQVVSIGGVLAVTLDSDPFPENLPEGQVIGTLTIPDGVTVELAPGYDAGGRVAIAGTNLLTTDLHFNYEAAATHEIRFIATRADPFTQVVSAHTLTVTDEPDGENLTLPTIEGTDQVGQVKSGTNGTYSIDPISFVYQWQRSDPDPVAWEDIPGAISETVLYSETEQGMIVRRGERPTNAEGFGDWTYSAPSGVVAAAPGLLTEVDPPVLTSLGKVNATAEIEPAIWSGLPASVEYIVVIDGDDFTSNGTDIDFLVPGEAFGHSLSVRELGTVPAGTSSSSSNSIDITEQDVLVTMGQNAQQGFSIPHLVDVPSGNTILVTIPRDIPELTYPV